MSNNSSPVLGVARQSVLLAFGGCVGVFFVWAAFHFAWLNWVVDGPGWLVSRFISIDFHEGDVPGFLLAIFLSWLWTSLITYLLARFAWRNFRMRSRMTVNER
jgi:hypothetical protein